MIIAIAACHKAEKKGGLAPGGALQNWTETELEIDELLMSD